MVHLSATVVHEGGGKVLLPWEITECHLEMIIVREFFRTLLLPRLGLFDIADEPEEKMTMNNDNNFSPVCLYYGLSDEKQAISL